MKPESAELFFQEGSSDKVYRASLEQDERGWVVNFAYGRRGTALTTGTKTPTAVGYGVAKKVYDKLIVEKTSKGYTNKEGGNTFSGTIGKGGITDTGHRVQLLNEIEVEDVERYIVNRDFCMQEKYDGRRRLLIKDEKGNVMAANRKGLACIASDPIMDALRKIPGEIILDGEDMGDYMMVFDALNVGRDIRHMSYQARYVYFEPVLFNNKVLKTAPIAWTAAEKRLFLAKLRKSKAEGVVFKDIRAEYTAGRPSSYGAQLKYKFVSTASCIVGGINVSKRSISLQVIENGRVVDVGNVTVYPNQVVPSKGSIVEVRYLYYFTGGSLYQPVLLGEGNVERDDLALEDCSYDQLKHKPVDE